MKTSPTAICKRVSFRTKKDVPVPYDEDQRGWQDPNAINRRSERKSGGISRSQYVNVGSVVVEMSKKRQTPEHLSKERDVKSWTKK